MTKATIQNPIRTTLLQKCSPAFQDLYIVDTTAFAEAGVFDSNVTFNLDEVQFTLDVNALNKIFAARTHNSALDLKGGVTNEKVLEALLATKNQNANIIDIFHLFAKYLEFSKEGSALIMNDLLSELISLANVSLLNSGVIGDGGILIQGKEIPSKVEIDLLALSPCYQSLFNKPISLSVESLNLLFNYATGEATVVARDSDDDLIAELKSAAADSENFLASLNGEKLVQAAPEEAEGGAGQTSPSASDLSVAYKIIITGANDQLKSDNQIPDDGKAVQKKSQVTFTDDSSTTAQVYQQAQNTVTITKQDGQKVTAGDEDSADDKVDTSYRPNFEAKFVHSAQTAQLDHKTINHRFSTSDEFQSLARLEDEDDFEDCLIEQNNMEFQGSMKSGLYNVLFNQDHNLKKKIPKREYYPNIEEDDTFEGHQQHNDQEYDVIKLIRQGYNVGELYPVFAAHFEANLKDYQKVLSKSKFLMSELLIKGELNPVVGYYLTNIDVPGKNTELETLRNLYEIKLDSLFITDSLFNKNKDDQKSEEQEDNQSKTLGEVLSEIENQQQVEIINLGTDDIKSFKKAIVIDRYIGDANITDLIEEEQEAIRDFDYQERIKQFNSIEKEVVASLKDVEFSLPTETSTLARTNTKKSNALKDAREKDLKSKEHLIEKFNELLDIGEFKDVGLTFKETIKFTLEHLFNTESAPDKTNKSYKNAEELLKFVLRKSDLQYIKFSSQDIEHIILYAKHQKANFNIFVELLKLKREHGVEADCGKIMNRELTVLNLFHQHSNNLKKIALASQDDFLKLVGVTTTKLNQNAQAELLKKIVNSNIQKGGLGKDIASPLEEDFKKLDNLEIKALVVLIQQAVLAHQSEWIKEQDGVKVNLDALVDIVANAKNQKLQKLKDEQQQKQLVLEETQTAALKAQNAAAKAAQNKLATMDNLKEIELIVKKDVSSFINNYFGYEEEELSAVAKTSEGKVVAFCAIANELQNSTEDIDLLNTASVDFSKDFITDEFLEALDLRSKDSLTSALIKSCFNMSVDNSQGKANVSLAASQESFCSLRKLLVDRETTSYQWLNNHLSIISDSKELINLLVNEAQEEEATELLQYNSLLYQGVSLIAECMQPAEQ